MGACLLFRSQPQFIVVCGMLVIAHVQYIWSQCWLATSPMSNRQSSSFPQGIQSTLGPTDLSFTPTALNKHTCTILCSRHSPAFHPLNVPQVTSQARQYSTVVRMPLPSHKQTKRICIELPLRQHPPRWWPWPQPLLLQPEVWRLVLIEIQT